jgi:hypothetical protein
VWLRFLESFVHTLVDWAATAIPRAVTTVMNGYTAKMKINPTAIKIIRRGRSRVAGVMSASWESCHLGADLIETES